MMNTSPWLRLFVLLLAFSVAFPLFAYEYPLSSEAIREAYFLGKNTDGRGAETLAQYTHALPMPLAGPDIPSIQIETPFTAVAMRAAQTPGYHAQEAEQEFTGKPGVFRVRVEIRFTPTYPNPTEPSQSGIDVFWVPDFWKDFKIKLMQGREIAAQSVRAGPVYSYYAADVTGIIGAEIEMDYSPEEIGAAPVEVKVIAPNGQAVQTSFDLSTLN